MSTDLLDQTRTVAYHEAGHAIMALLGGVSVFTRVSIIRSGNSLGGTDYVQLTAAHLNSLPPSRRPNGLDEIREATLQRIIGGPMAQAMLLHAFPEYQAGTGDGDFDMIASLLLEMHPGIDHQGMLRVVAEWEPIVHSILTRVWPVVEALAQSLIDMGELTYEEALSVVSDAVRLLPPEDREWANAHLGRI